jgi:hypothetical protein
MVTPNGKSPPVVSPSMGVVKMVSIAKVEREKFIGAVAQLSQKA